LVWVLSSSRLLKVRVYVFVCCGVEYVCLYH